MIVDVHTHVFPDGLAARALEKLSVASGHRIHPVMDGTAAGLIRAMRQAQVDYAVVCPVATRPAQFEGILSEARAYRDGGYGEEARRCLIPLASVHPADDRRFEHLRQVAEHNLCGVKVHPYYQSFVLDAPEMLEYFRCCRDLGLIVQCHCGFDIGFPLDPICGPDRVAHLIREVQGLKFIAAHLGGWRQWGEVRRMLLGQEVYFDTAIVPTDLVDEDVLAILREHPVDKLLFGTDMPWVSFEAGLRLIRSSGLSEAAVAAISGENAGRLFGLAKTQAVAVPS